MRKRSYSTSRRSKFVMRKHTLTTWLTMGAIAMGNVALRISNLLAHPIARSTWILSSAIRRVFSTSDTANCTLPCSRGGMLSVTPFSAKRSWISNPRSAITLSPGSRRSNRPEFLVISRSETCPPHPAGYKGSLRPWK